MSALTSICVAMICNMYTQRVYCTQSWIIIQELVPTRDSRDYSFETNGFQIRDHLLLMLSNCSWSLFIVPYQVGVFPDLPMSKGRSYHCGLLVYASVRVCMDDCLTCAVSAYAHSCIWRIPPLAFYACLRLPKRTVSCVSYSFEVLHLIDCHPALCVNRGWCSLMCHDLECFSLPIVLLATLRFVVCLLNVLTTSVRPIRCIPNAFPLRWTKTHIQQLCRNRFGTLLFGDFPDDGWPTWEQTRGTCAWVFISRSLSLSYFYRALSLSLSLSLSVYISCSLFIPALYALIMCIYLHIYI